MARYHIECRGSDQYEDIDLETDQIPKEIRWRYPFISITVLTPVSRADVVDNLYRTDDQNLY